MINEAQSARRCKGSERSIASCGSSLGSSVRVAFLMPNSADIVVYSIVFMIPPATLLVHSAKASYVFLVVIFAVSAWNGATFYVEVFGRK